MSIDLIFLGSPIPECIRIYGVIIEPEDKIVPIFGLILKLLPSTTNLNHDNLYSRLLEICHYVASLSDRKALNVYNKITGVEYQ
mgnify:CR=1 FL=1